MKSIPSQLLEMFQDTFGHNFPFTEADQWSFYTETGILKCSLRDVSGSAEDYEWVLNRQMV